MQKGTNDMRNIKRLAALALAVVMCMAFSVTAFAATDAYTITVNNAVPGHTYRIYRMLDLSVSAEKDADGNRTAYSYFLKSDSPWKAFFEDQAKGGMYFDIGEERDVSTADGNVKGYYVTLKADVAPDMSAFGKAAEAFAATAGDQNTPLPAEKTVAIKDDGTTDADIKISGADDTDGADRANWRKFTIPMGLPGYYLICSSVGSQAIVSTTPTDKNGVVTEKNPVPTIDKSITEVDGEKLPAGSVSTSEAQIGSKVSYEIAVHVPSTVFNTTDEDGNTVTTGAEKYVIHDKISDGLTMDYDSVKLSLKRGTNDPIDIVKGTDYDVKQTGECGEGKCKLEIVFTDSFLSTKLQANDTIVLNYSATVNEKALIGTFGNTAWLNYGGDGFGDGQAKTPDVGTGGDPDPDPEDPKPGVQVFKLAGIKYYTNDKKPVPLADAEFRLYKGTGDAREEVSLVKMTAAEIEAAGDRIDLGGTMNTMTPASGQAHVAYRVAKANETGEAVKTGTTGGFVIFGLAAGDYELEETKAPAGYNKLSKPIQVRINAATVGADGVTLPEYELTETTATGTVDLNNLGIENVYGTQMPETGGMGTKLLYIAGAVLVVGAVVFLVARKRSDDEDDDE